MGCDIHGRLQMRWSPASKYGDEGEVESDRNYAVFAMLANVRNRGDIEPVAEPRGFPADFEVINGDATPIHWGNDGEAAEYWMGDHSHSWVTLPEVILGLARNPQVREWAPTFCAWVEYLRIKYSGLLSRDPAAVRLVFGFDN